MKRDNFGSKVGALAAAVGSAIGLGNIWRFPYIVGENGGAAFILVYIICVLVIGAPLMITEFAIGRNTQANASGAFKKLKLDSKWNLAGFLAILTSFIILSFYSMIAGWILSYFGNSLTGKMISVAPEKLPLYFENMSSNAPHAIFCTAIVIVITAFIVISGVKKGIEKYSKILMPILLVSLVILMIRSLTLDGASKGLDFLFKVDFSKITAKSLLEALGHAFYSLSLGMGIIMTYGGYISKDEKIPSLSFQIIAADTLIALMAGIVIFPAVFAYGFKPETGPSLIFITLPAVFKEMAFGSIFQTLFFLLVGIASITSTISLLEVSVSFVMEKFNMKRKKATIILASILFLLSIPSTLSFGAWKDVTIFGKTFYDIMDFMASYTFLPISGMLICIFASRVWGTKNVLKEITNDGTYSFKGFKAYNFIIKYIAPIAIVIIFLYSTGIIKF